MSGATFRIGERALLVGCEPRYMPNTALGRYFGTEVVVASNPLPDRRFEGGCFQVVVASDGFALSVAPDTLRKIPPLDPGYMAFRDRFVREFALDAEPPVLQPRHPSITAMLQLIGQDGVR